MAILYETDELILENEYESTWLKSKSTGKVLLEDELYGDPQCGLIDANNNWAIVAGEHLTIWSQKKSEIIKHEGIKWVHSLRLKNPETVEILIDPWSNNSSIWEINIHTFEVQKVKDFNDYKDKEYTDEVIW